MLSPIQSTTNKSLTVEIEGIRNNKGYILLAIYASADGFPDSSEKAIVRKRIQAQSGKMSISVENLKPGKYAFGIVHDENDNQKLDTGLFGIPKEGFCFSKQAMGTFGPPDFKDAQFEYNENTQVQKVKVSYW
jgi:uncharacterized protein (DUF2141 family)